MKSKQESEEKNLKQRQLNKKVVTSIEWQSNPQNHNITSTTTTTTTKQPNNKVKQIKSIYNQITVVDNKE